MIYGVRFEGGASSADELEREFDVLAVQLAQVGFFEGVLGREQVDTESVIESALGQTTQVGHRHYDFRYRGRRKLTFVVPEYDDFLGAGPRPQPDYKVFAMLGGGPGEEPTEQVEQHGAIVLQRMNPLPEHRRGEPLLKDEVEDFAIEVFPWECDRYGHPLMPGWTRIVCSIFEKRVHGHGPVTIAERFVQESIVEEKDAQDEAEAMFASAQAYVSGILHGRSGGVRYFTSTLEEQATASFGGGVVTVTGSSGSNIATAEEVLDNIRRLKNFGWLQAEPILGEGWKVVVENEQRRVESIKPTLVEAALDAYGQCGITTYETTEPAQ